MLNVFILLCFYYLVVVLATRRSKLGCTGFCIFHIHRWQVELWICPPHTLIPLHKHPREHVKLWFLRGKDTVIFKRDVNTDAVEQYTLRFPKVLRRMFYLVPKQSHGFKVATSTLVFLNFQRWIGQGKVTSAADDFIDAQTQLNLTQK